MVNIIYVLLLLKLVKDSEQFMVPVIAPIAPVIYQYGQASISHQSLNPPAIVRPYNNPYSQSSLSQNVKYNQPNYKIQDVKDQAYKAFDLGLIPQKQLEDALSRDENQVQKYEDIRENMNQEYDKFIIEILEKCDKFWVDFFKILKEQAENDGDVITARELSRILQEDPSKASNEDAIIQKFIAPNIEKLLNLFQNTFKGEDIKQNYYSIDISKLIQENPRYYNADLTKKESESKISRLRELIKKDNKEIKNEIAVDSNKTQRLNDFFMLIAKLSQYDPDLNINIDYKKYIDEINQGKNKDLLSLKNQGQQNIDNIQ